MCDTALFATAEDAYGDISGWDVSAITDMSELFKDEDTCNLDISGWNVSSVTNMYRMFYGASAFNNSRIFT